MVVLFDQFNMPDDIFKVIFATEQQETVARLLIKHIKENGGEIGKTEMSIGDLFCEICPHSVNICAIPYRDAI